ncbi:MAG: DEAD/DEAH box helicase family protein, partial [Hydrogenophilales bacterium]|nr:DEAD/DEAH box helicase family protein [Hydrogenophilales bacterium]
MNEAETRAEHIDPALAAAGWGVVEGSRIRREYSITLGRIKGQGQRGKPLTADYVLEYRNTKLAVVEAKAWDEGLTEGVAQAKNYAGKLSIRYTYSTNGRGIYGIDMHTGIEGELAQYPSPDELWNRIYATQNTWRDRFAAVPFEDRGGYFQGRYYQDIAIERVMAAIADQQQRILLTLATGTGKTFIAFQIAWKLFHSRWNLGDWKKTGEPTRRPRILFLADRNILANQAFNAFSAFEDSNPGSLVRIAPEDIRKKGKVPKNGSVFFTIFQTFMASAGSATEGSATEGSATEGSATEGSATEGSATEGSATDADNSIKASLKEIGEIKDAHAYTYILECADGSFYTGSTVDLKLRLEQHRNGEGAKHTKTHAPVKLVYYESHDRVDIAFAREKQIQGWSRAKKIALINGNTDLLRPLSKSTSAPEPVEGYFGEYPPDFFDFIVIDECHRGGANDESNWRGILDYFAPAVQLGLTATPKRRDNVDTYAYFGEPVFIYSLKDGINDGFLTPFKVKQIETTLDEYTYTPDDKLIEGEIEVGRRYT